MQTLFYSCSAFCTLTAVLLFIYSSDVTKAVRCKAKAKAKTLTFKTKAKAKTLTLKAKTKTKTMSLKAEAKTKTLALKAKTKAKASIHFNWKCSLI